MDCTTIREQLLDYLYDACEADVAATIATHLPGCADCTASLREADAQRGVLAEAAAVAGPALQLHRPAADAPGVDGAPRRRTSLRRILTHAAAALLVVGVGVFSLRATRRSAAAQQYPSLIVRGPSVLPVGGPARLTVEPRDAWDRPIEAAIAATVLDTTGVELGTAVVTRGPNGAAYVDVPGDCGKPGEYVAVQIAAAFGAGPDAITRYLTPVVLRDTRHLLARIHTDKPLYQPGEVVRARMVALERTSLRPAGAVPMHLKLLDPKGGVVNEIVVPSQDGVSAMQWQLDGGAVGGAWTVECSHPEAAFPPVRRTFVVRSYQAPRLRTDLRLDRDSYAPGEAGFAWLTVSRSEGGVPGGGVCETTLSVDGVAGERTALTLPASGLVRVPFALPASVEHGRGLLAVAINDGGVVQTATKTVPISLNRLDIELFPEGGDLVAGLPNRVYFDVRDALGEPADCTVEVLDGADVVARGRVFKRGMGLFDLTPRADAVYRLRAASPSGVALRGQVPAVAPGGVTLRALDAHSAAGAPVRVEIGSTVGGTHTLVAVCRGAQVGQATATVAAGATAEVAIPLTGDLGGVMRITVFDASGLPRAERLVHVEPPRRLAVEVTPEHERYAPGETVNVTVRARDEAGEPVAGAVLGATVANQAVIDFAEDHDTPDLAMHFLLGLEVKELEEVEVFADGPDARRAVDLLLGVQGWRRFGWRDAQAFLAANPEHGPRAVAPVDLAGVTPFLIDTRPHVQEQRDRAFAAVDARICGVVYTALAITLLLGMVSGLIYALVQTFRRAVTAKLSHIGVGLGTSVLCALVLEMWVTSSVGMEYAPGVALGTDANWAFSTNDSGGVRDGTGPYTAGAADTAPNVYRDSNISVRFTTPVDPGSLNQGRFALRERTQADLDEVGIFTGAVSQPQIRDASGGTPLGTWTARNSWSPAADTVTRLAREVEATRQLGRNGLPAGFISSIAVRLDEAWRLRDPRGGGGGGAGGPLLLTGPNVRFVSADGMFADRFDTGWSGQFELLTREYRHTARQPAEGDHERTDFTEVLYWHPLLVTDAKGEARFEFDTCDAIAGFRIAIDAHDARGALTTAAGHIENRKPFYLEPKLPVALSAGDRLLLPIAIVNDTEQAASIQTHVTADGLATLEGSLDRTTPLAASGRGRVLHGLVAQNGAGDITLAIDGVGPAGMTDHSTHTIAVHPRGYPVTLNASGVIEKRDRVDVLMPDTVAHGTLQGGLRIYPSMLATLADGLEGMLRQPSGCFEQVSSSNYPNLLVLTYLEEQQVAAPDAAIRARGYLEAAYARLSGYECTERGFEWYGDDPGHVALTAYGLMQFVDMGRVFTVDDDMVLRTRDWLLRHRDGKGGFTRNDGKYANFDRSSQATFDAYVTWALSEAGLSGVDLDLDLDLDAEVALVAERAAASDDPYLVALAANTLLNRKSPATDLVARLAQLQQADGRLAGTTTSITSSRGVNLDIETTALAALAFAKVGSRLANAEQAVRWILEQRRGDGSFGSTQACILALRALVAHARVARRTSTEHHLTVLVNGQPVWQQHLPAGTTGVIHVDDALRAALTPGRNTVELRTTGAEVLPWALGVTYRTLTPPTHPGCAVRVRTALASTVLDEGDTTRCTVTVTNTTNQPVPMTLSRVGLPAGLTPRVAQLRELREQGRVGMVETRPREVTLYWRGLEAGATRTIHLDLVAELPGTFEGPATSAYLYYTDDQQAWAAPLTVTIGARK